MELRAQSLAGQVMRSLPVSFGSLLSAWCKQVPRRAPGKADLDVRGVVCQAPASTTGRLVLQLKAKGARMCSL
jgi:hypothetical protein